MNGHFTAAPAALGDVAAFIRGITFKPDDVISPENDGTVACMRTKNVQMDLDISDVWGVPQSFVKNKDQFLKTGDILVSTANSWNLVGNVAGYRIYLGPPPWAALFLHSDQRMERLILVIFIGGLRRKQFKKKSEAVLVKQPTSPISALVSA